MEKKRVKIERYTQSQFDSMIRSSDTIYITIDTNHVYLGDALLSGGGFHFENTGSGWRFRGHDGTKFDHRDNDSVIDEHDEILSVSHDTLDERNNNDFPVDRKWKTLFSSDMRDPDLGYDNPRVVIDSSKQNEYVSVDLVVETDDPVTKLETHGIFHLGVNVEPGLHEFNVAEYDLEGKDWRVTIQSNEPTNLFYTAFRWGEHGGFKATVSLTRPDHEQDLKLWGRDDILLSTVDLSLNKDNTISGDGTTIDPYRVTEYDDLIKRTKLHESGKLVVGVPAIVPTKDGIALELDVKDLYDESITHMVMPIDIRDLVVTGHQSGKITISAPWRHGIMYEVWHTDKLSGTGNKHFHGTPLDVTLKVDGGNGQVEQVVYRDKEFTGLNGPEVDMRYNFENDPPPCSTCPRYDNKKCPFIDDSNCILPEQVRLKFVESGTDKVLPVEIEGLDLSSYVDGESIKWDAIDNVLRGVTTFNWFGKDDVVTFRKGITQLEYDDMVAHDTLDGNTVYFLKDTLKIYVGLDCFTKDYTENDELPRIYDAEWKPEYPSWKQNWFYQRGYRVTLEDKNWLCTNNHNSGLNFDDKYWEECDPIEPTKIRRIINEGPNDFQVAFAKHDSNYPFNDNWRIEHTFDLRVIPDPNDQSNARGCAQFCIDGEPVTFEPGDFVYAKNIDQDIGGVKTFLGDCRVQDPPIDDLSAVPKKYVDEVAADTLASATAYTDVEIQKIDEKYTEITDTERSEREESDQYMTKKYDEEVQRLKDGLVVKSDIYHPNLDHNDFSLLKLQDRIQFFGFEKNPTVNSDFSVTFEDYATSTTLIFEKKGEHYYFNGDEVFDDGEEVFLPTFETPLYRWYSEDHVIRLFKEMEVTELSDDFETRVVGRGLFFGNPLEPTVDCEWLYKVWTKPKWSTVAEKPFEGIGPGLMVEDDLLQVELCYDQRTRDNLAVMPGLLFKYEDDMMITNRTETAITDSIGPVGALWMELNLTGKTDPIHEFHAYIRADDGSYELPIYHGVPPTSIIDRIDTSDFVSPFKVYVEYIGQWDLELDVNIRDAERGIKYLGKDVDDLRKYVEEEVIRLEGLIEDERIRAEAKEGELEILIDEEAQRATDRENDLEGLINDEENRAKTREDELDKKIDDAVIEMKDLVDTIDQGIDDKINDLGNTINIRIDGVDARITNLGDTIDNRITNLDNSINNRIDGVENHLYGLEVPPFPAGDGEWSLSFTRRGATTGLEWIPIQQQQP